ncbi:Uncharacterised protein [uncultured archaeon]|nr:Uncharacterised protein [uncultured archaeon]
MLTLYQPIVVLKLVGMSHENAFAPTCVIVVQLYPLAAE